MPVVIPALVLATGVALPLHRPAAFTAAHEGHWHSALADHPVESGRPRPSAHQRRPRALHKSPRQAKDSAWYVLTVPQLERPSARLEPRRLPVLRPGLLLHATGESTGNWIRTYVPGGRSWIYRANVRPAAAPRGWLKIHPVQQRRVVPPPRVSHLPLPATGAAAVLPAAPLATPAVVLPHATAVPQVVQVVQVAQPAPVVQVVQPIARTPVQSIYYWASVYGVNADSLLRTAQCESGLNAGAYNPSGASGGLQFMPSTFSYYAGQLSWDHAPSYWNFDDSARVAALMWSQGQQSQWVCYGMVG